MAIDLLHEAGTANRVDLRSLLYATSSTYHQSQFPYSFGRPTSERWLTPITEEEEEEREWDRIVNKAHVQQALRRMANEARQQYYARETEEGGFGLE
jgi:hypothetical protein